VQADGKVLAGGQFSGANSIGGQTRNFIARLDATTGLADSFDPNANLFVSSIAVQADGKILAGGGFTTIGGQTRNNIARLETDGRLDQTLNLSAVGSFVYATAVQPDGKILIGGTFSSVLGVPRNNIARLNPDGTLDTAFDPNAINTVRSIAVQADGKILAGGSFTNIGGQPRNRIARLDATSGAADSFDPNANDRVYSIAVQADGKILAGGNFTSIGGATRNRIARLDATTGAADSFDPNASGGGGNDAVYSIAVQADGKILAGGVFTSIGGAARNHIAQLDAITGLADSFSPAPTLCSVNRGAGGRQGLGGRGFTSIGGRRAAIPGSMARQAWLTFDRNANVGVFTIAVQADGKILAGGDFTSIGGQTRSRIARLDATTGAADSFDPNASGGMAVYSIAAQTDGKVLAGGDFTSIGGQTRSRFARLSNDTAALQNLAVTQTTITWTLGGSSSQFTRVTFESSTDNVNYTPLGDGTAAGGDWTLTGLNLPTGQNIYIRARGYYRTGYQNGSESITESVRNAFLAGTLQLTAAVSRKTHGGAGTFDVPLPLTGEPGVECRSTNGRYRFVFTFSSDVVSGSAAVTSGAGRVQGSPIFSGNTMTVNLRGVTDVQKITVTLSDVTSSTGQVPDTALSANMSSAIPETKRSITPTSRKRRSSRPACDRHQLREAERRWRDHNRRCYPGDQTSDIACRNRFPSGERRKFSCRNITAVCYSKGSSKKVQRHVERLREQAAMFDRDGDCSNPNAGGKIRRTTECDHPRRR
jgi:uncharacterized delta-60 repeat protein